jgi:hypothetical protein
LAHEIHVLRDHYPQAPADVRLQHAGEQHRPEALRPRARSEHDDDEADGAVGGRRPLVLATTSAAAGTTTGTKQRLCEVVLRAVLQEAIQVLLLKRGGRRHDQPFTDKRQRRCR